jgi:cyclopropane fatty-acyl-phospholipid synthase-like methyltransferase
MTTTFGRIAYETLDVCNGVKMAAVEAAVARAGLSAGARVADIGTGNAGVAIRLCQVFGFDVTAIEFDPVMAELAAARIATAGVKVDLVVGSAAQVLAGMPPLDLIVALGTTNLTGEGRPPPEAGFAFLKQWIMPGGWLLWGDLVWLGEPSAPLRQVVEATNLYTDDKGWIAAAKHAGFVLDWREISSQAVFDGYARDAVGAARTWLEAYPGAPEADAVRFHADRMQAVFEFGRGLIGFGLYLFRAPD